MNRLDKLLADCNARGIRLRPAAAGGLTIVAPRAALTPELLDRLKFHKAELLAFLTPPPKRVCRCGASSWRDVILHHAPHNGTTIRRDCAECGRFLDFPLWYGQEADRAASSQ